MSRLTLWFLMALALIGAGCGYGSKSMVGGGGGGSPNITQLVPGNATAGGMAFTLTVNGSGFGTDATVYWGTSQQSTMYLSSNQVTAQIPAGDIMNPGTVSVYVRSGGMNSNSANFEVQ